MSKRSNKSAGQSNDQGSGGTITKVDGQAAGVAPEGGSSESGDTQTEEQAAAPDPFADVPVTRIGDEVSFEDFSDIATGDPRKYAAVHTAAVAERLPTVKGWKHERAMLVPGRSSRELKPTSVYGTIQQIVQAAGKAGIPAYVVANKVRRMQVGNKRSHYCVNGDAGALPAIGWAEGWLNTAITKGIVGVHPTKQAPAIRETVTEGEAKANQAEAQGKIAAAA